MKDMDFDFSNKATWEHSFKELWIILGKRLISLPSKLIGFKPFCLLVATWLLVNGHIRDWIWFSVLMIVLFGIDGLKEISKWRDTDNKLTGFGKGVIAGLVLAVIIFGVIFALMYFNKMNASIVHG